MQVGMIFGLALVPIILVVWGWALNIIALVHMSAPPFTGEFILRAIGIVLMPLGAIMGFFV